VLTIVWRTESIEATNSRFGGGLAKRGSPPGSGRVPVACFKMTAPEFAGARGSSGSEMQKRRQAVRDRRAVKTQRLLRTAEGKSRKTAWALI